MIIIRLFFQDIEDFRAFFEHYKRSKSHRALMRRQSESYSEDNTDSDTSNPTRNLTTDTLPMSLGLSIAQIWQDPGVLQVYRISHEFQLNETAE